MLYPKISILHKGHLLPSVFLDKQRRQFTVGAHPENDFTLLKEGICATIPLFRFEGDRLILTLEQDMQLVVTTDHNKLDLPALVGLGMASAKGNRMEVSVKINQTTTGTLRWHDFFVDFGFTEKEVAAEVIVLEPIVYFKEALKNADWSFLFIFLLTVVLSLRGGYYLYGLPTFSYGELMVPPPSAPTSTVIMPEVNVDDLIRLPTNRQPLWTQMIVLAARRRPMPEVPRGLRALSAERWHRATQAVEARFWML